MASNSLPYQYHQMSCGQLEVGGLVFVVFDDVLADVLHDHRELFGFVLLVEGEAEHGVRP